MSLSNFDEKSVYGKKMMLIEARNEILVLEDEQGTRKEYVDMMSAYGSCNFGHCNEKISPFKAYRADLAACFYPPEAEDYSNWLIKKLNYPNHEVLYQVGGSAAVSAAVSIALRVRRGKIAYINGSFHGLGLDALNITSTHKSLALQNTDLVKGLENHCVEIPVGCDPSKIEWDDISCLVYEPIQGAKGYIPLSISWLEELIFQAQSRDVTVIADEIQCGYYRHGGLSVSLQNNLFPDILLFGKSMTNGLFPFSAVVYPKKFATIINQDLFLAHTYQTSALGCYAADAVSRYIDSHDVEAECKKIEDIFLRYSKRLKSTKHLVRNLYVTGPTLSFEVADSKSKELVQTCLQYGILIFTGGASGERVRIAPPITIDVGILEQSLDIICDKVEDLAREGGRNLVV